MKIIIVNKKSEFKPQQISELEKYGEVVFVESSDEWNGLSKKLSKEEKIIALDPGIADWKFPNEEVDQVFNLKAVCLPTTKYGWVDGTYLRKRGIVLTNVPKYSTESVAEHCIFLMFSLSKKLPLIINNGWKLDYDKHLGHDIKGKNMGIIGLGDIGTRAAELGSGMGMNVMYWSRSSRNEKYTYLEMEELIKISDYILLTIAEGPETKNFFDKTKVDLMKENSYLINISGDEVWDFDYIQGAVKTGRIAGAALDDDRREIKDYGCNILITPHIAWYTKESFEEDFRVWTECMISAAKDSPLNVVN